MGDREEKNELIHLEIVSLKPSKDVHVKEREGHKLER